MTRRLRLVAVLLVLICLPLGGILGLRLYYNDTRLAALLRQFLQERLQTNVALGALQVRLASGMQVTDLRVGPLPGFTLDTLAVHHVACRWDLPALLHGRIALHELTVEGVRLGWEETPRGTTLQQLRALILPHHPGNAPVSTAPTPEAPTEGPRLPVPVHIEQLRLELQTLEMRRPGMQVKVGDVHLTGQVDAVDTSVDAALQLRIGSSQATEWQVQLGAPARRVQLRHTLTAEVQTGGLGDVRLQVAWDGVLRVEQAGATLPPLPLHATTLIQADLLRDTVDLTQTSLDLGQALNARAALHVEDLLHAPTLQIDNLSAVAHLAAMQPYAQVLLPRLLLQGEIQAQVSPGKSALVPWSEVQSSAELQLHGVDVALPGLHVEGLQGHGSLQSAHGLLQAHGALTSEAVQAGPLVVHGLQTQVHATSELLPWLASEPVAAVPLQATFAVATVEAAMGANQAALHEIAGSLDGNIPVAWVRRLPHAAPATLQLHSKITSVQAAAHAARDVTCTAGLQLADTQGASLNGDVDVQVAHLATVLQEHPISLPHVVLKARGERRGDGFYLQQLQVRAAQGLVTTLSGGVEAPGSDTPVLHSIRWEVGPLDAVEALSFVPATMQPSVRLLKGALHMQAAAEGPVPVAELAALAHFPPAANFNDAIAWQAFMQETIARLRGWATLFTAGLPMSGNLRFDLTEAEVEGAGLHIQGAQVHGDVGVRRFGPYIELASQATTVETATAMRGVSGRVQVHVQGAEVDTHVEAGVHELALPGQEKPLTDLGLTVGATYQLGGDLTLQGLEVDAAAMSTHVHAAGMVLQPLAALAGRAWEQAGLPGLESRLEWHVAVHTPQEARLTQAGISLAGDLDVRGAASLTQGQLNLSGGMQLHDLSFEQGSTTAQMLSGELPFDVRLLFGQAPQYVPVARDLPVGGGIVSLRVANQDVREGAARPAYYDRLRPYRSGSGLTALRLTSGPYEVRDVALEGRLQDGMLQFDWIAMSVLGGDVLGNVALQLGLDSTARGDMSFKVSNLDASYFPALKLQPGEESEMSADLRLSFLFGAQGRDVSLNMDVTKIGAKALDRFLQLLDPDARDAKLQQTRGNLRFVRIREIALWVRYENLNMDMTYDPLVRIPFTDIGYRPIDRELLRRYAIGESLLDVYVQPSIDRLLGPMLGWNHRG